VVDPLGVIILIITPNGGDTGANSKSICLVGNLLTINPETGLEYMFKAAGEEYSQLRENSGHIFLSDPIHEMNFQSYFLDEIKKLSGTHKESAYNQKWLLPPCLLILSVLKSAVISLITFIIIYKALLYQIL
jgi:hypothetical protein